MKLEKLKFILQFGTLFLPSASYKANTLYATIERKVSIYNVPKELEMTASNTSSTVMASICEPYITLTEGPIGRQICGSVGPKIATVVRPSMAARCVMPESLPR